MRTPPFVAYFTTDYPAQGVCDPRCSTLVYGELEFILFDEIREPLFAGRACNEFLQDVLAHFCPRYLHRPHPTPTLTLILPLTPTPTRPLTV